MRLATQNKPFFPTSFAQKLTAVRSLGFEGFEIDGKELIDRYEEVKAAIRDTQMPVVTACGGYRGWIGDFNADNRRQAIHDIREILKRLSEIGGQGIVVPAAWGMFSRRLPPHVPPRSEEEDRIVLLESLHALNGTAQETGTNVYLEPLNRYEDHMLNRLSEAVDLIRAGGFGHVRVTADFYHMNIEEPRIEASIGHAGAYIGHVHLSDSNRFQPGNGHLDFGAGFEALRAIGYDGWMSFECRVAGTPEIEKYHESVQFIRRVYAA